MQNPPSEVGIPIVDHGHDREDDEERPASSSGAAALRAQVRDLQERLDLEAPPALLTSRAPSMRSALDAVGRAARADGTVLLLGAKGTGKKLLGWEVHRASARAGRPFVVMNCAASADQTQIADNLARGGRLFDAAGGTLLLDEIHLLSADLQAQVARFSDGQTLAAGTSPSDAPARLRLIATTSVEVESLAGARRLRPDVLDRRNGIEIQVPPLRERPSDIMPLARHFLDFFSRACGRSSPRFSNAFEAMLARHHWPGNVRELRNVVERAVLLGESETLEPNAFVDGTPTIRVPLAFIGGHFTLDAIERAHILGVIARTRTLDEAAQALGIDTSTLWRKRKKYLDDQLQSSPSDLPREAAFTRRSEPTTPVADGAARSLG